ncbi:hypothetical protein H5410_036677 [Solanum commersonii]|uniref:Uncharacterized protein n=1 Tax=Solanum commersonii TaxID=4109 RepID=A0A9J5Y5J0_SOLCO|nr:hypothetical protein H5410_036677 [Solanum commersonii]
MAMLQRRRDGSLEGIGSSRQVEALDGVQIAAMSDQIAKLTTALAESERRRVTEQEIMSETVQQIKEQVMNLARRPTTAAPDDTDDESDEDDYANSQKSHSHTCKNIITRNSYIDLIEPDLPNNPGTGKNHHEDKAPTGKTHAKLGEDFVLPTPISQNPPFVPNILAGMDKEGNTKASKSKGIDSMLPLPLTPLDNCLTIVEAIGVLDGVLDGGLEGNITNLQERVSKWGFLHHENLHTDPKKDPGDSATTSHQTT